MREIIEKCKEAVSSEVSEVRSEKLSNMVGSTDHLVWWVAECNK